MNFSGGVWIATMSPGDLPSPGHRRRGRKTLPACQIRNRLFPATDVESKGTGSRLVHNGPIRADDIQTLRQRGVCQIGGVSHVVQQHGHCQLEMAHSHLGDADPFFHRLGLVEHDRVGKIGRALPSVFGMRLLYVYAEEVGRSLESLVDMIETPGLGTKRRSGVGTKNQGNRLVQMVEQAALLVGSRALRA